MKKSIRAKEFQIWFVLSITVIIVLHLVVSGLIENRNENEEIFSNQEIKSFQGEVDSTLTTYQAFSDYIFDGINEDQEVLSIMYKANAASDEEKAVLREQLYNKLHKKYIRMKKYEYRQLHFHLPNTESFLRVHAPEKHGDILSNVRESVRLVNENNSKVAGFEEGKIFNGFRYVYPLKYKDIHTGSVEVSISSASIIEVLSKLYPDEDFYFIIDKDTVEKNLFAEEMINYKKSNIFEKYYTDREVDQITKDYNKIVPEPGNVFFEGFKEVHSEKLKDKKSFSTNYKFNDKNYLINFLSIENLKDLPVAYLISVSESLAYEKFNKQAYHEIILVAIVGIIIIISSLILAIYQRKLRNTSELDFLTGLYNRNKFYEIVKKEVRSSKRYEYDSSIMMIDIDHFKNINDKYGHEWGDKVLKKLADEILDNIRDTDVFARWGGEEFVILLPHTNKKDGFKAAEKIRKLICQSKSSKLKDVTISIGLSKIDCENYDVDKAIKLADQAMYEAKRNGRNQVFYK